jgi:L-alanine-DL-glutamate epimerase-like enolase superfamily enzyme
VGRGEATLLPNDAAHRPAALRAQFAEVRGSLDRMISPVDLPGLLPAGPLRSAMDAALWNVLARRSGQPVWKLIGAPRPRPVPVVRTLLSKEQDALERELKESVRSPSLNLPLGGGAVEDDVARLGAVTRHRPDAWLMADAAGAWDADRLHTMLPVLREHGVRLLERPLPEAESGALATLRRPFPIITRLGRGAEGDVERLVSRYDGIHLGLDAVGGLTTAVRLMEQADQRGLLVLLGSPPASARSWAAALHAAPGAHYVNLSQELVLPGETSHASASGHGLVAPPPASVWG